jgi:hypothetical protein
LTVEVPALLRIPTDEWSVMLRTANPEKLLDSWVVIEVVSRPEI